MTRALTRAPPVAIPTVDEIPTEGKESEPSVRRKRDPLFKSALQWQRDRCNDQVLDAARFKEGNGANEAGFVGHRTKKCWK
jgi:hypothetical protein